MVRLCPDSWLLEVVESPRFDAFEICKKTLEKYMKRLKRSFVKCSRRTKESTGPTIQILSKMQKAYLIFMSRLININRPMSSLANYSRPKKGWGPTHLKVLQCRDGLSEFLARMGRYQESEAIKCDVIEGFKEIVGPLGLETASSLLNLAFLYSDLKEFRKPRRSNIK